MGVITYNNVASDTLGIVVEHPPSRVMPERNVTKISVPGRNTEVLIDEGTYKNVLVPYEIAIGAYDGNFDALADKIVRWLHSSSGYARLEDSFDSTHYRMGIYAESGEIENILSKAGRAKVNFDCGPQRFLKTGDIQTTFTSSGTITNPTKHNAKPIITLKIHGNSTGTLNIAGQSISIKAMSTSSSIITLTINSEVGDAYSGSTNRNAYITMNNHEFPELKPGSNYISFSGGITEVSIIPKWWEV